jgi:PIN domain nuclease of toxin-antitoxin system
MIRAIADTHTVIWYLGADSRLSTTARSTIEAARSLNDHIGVSAITVVEMIYLVEKGRIDAARLSQLRSALDRRRAVLRIIPLGRAVAEAMQQVIRTEVPEMSDRIIGATALYLSVPVITRDTDLSNSQVPTVW